MRLKALERKVLDLALDYGRAEDGTFFTVNTFSNSSIDVCFFSSPQKIVWFRSAYISSDNYGENLLEIINEMLSEYKIRLKKENRPADQSNGAVNNINFI